MTCLNIILRPCEADKPHRYLYILRATSLYFTGGRSGLIVRGRTESRSTIRLRRLADAFEHHENNV